MLFERHVPTLVVSIALADTPVGYSLHDDAEMEF